MKTKLELRDRHHEHETITGYKQAAMIERMFGRGTWGLNICMDAPFTVMNSYGWVTGIAIFHEG